MLFGKIEDAMAGLAKTVSVDKRIWRCRTGLAIMPTTPGKRAMLAAALIFTVQPIAKSLANDNLPTGFDPNLSSGVMSVTTVGTTQTIATQAQRSVGSFGSFNIGAGHTVNVNQPSATASFMATVRNVGAPSQILGQLNSNGQVGIVNPAGVFVGSSGVVNTAGFVATTQRLNEQKYLDTGILEFNQNPADPADAAIVNHGLIKVAEGGSVTLAGPVVENHGTIEAPSGEVNLISSRQLTLSTLDGVQLTLDRSNLNQQDAGFQGIVNNTGSISVSGIAQQPGGGITLLASGGRLNFSGSALAEGGAGGNIDLFADELTVSGRLSADGTNGSGRIRVGGDYQGQTTDGFNASKTVITDTAYLSTNATENGNGGTLIAWADDETSVAGRFEAKGGSQSGNGGLVETSGKVTLKVEESTQVDTSAANGQTGTWLLDPENIVIANSGGTITPGTITTALASNNVVLHTANPGLSEAGNITITNALNYNSSNSLSLLATQDIYANASIQNAGSGDLNLVAGWDESTGLSGGVFTMADVLSNSSSYGNNNGSIFINNASGTQGVAVGSRNGVTSLAAYDTVLSGGSTYDSYAQIGFRVEDAPTGTASGSIFLKNSNDVSLNSGTGLNSYTIIGHGRVIPYPQDAELEGNLSGNITIDANNITLTSGLNDYRQMSKIGHGVEHANANLSGNIDLTTRGSVILTSGWEYNFTQIGHGIYDSGTKTGDITIAAGESVFLQGGTHVGAMTKIGHSGWSSGSGSGNITINATDIELAGGGAEKTFAMIGHGGAEASGAQSGGITISADNLTLQAGSGSESFSQVGHGGSSNSSGDLSGSIELELNQELSLSGGTGLYSWAHVGHGGGSHNGSINGNLSVQAGNNIQLQGGANDESYAQIGHGGSYTGGTIAGTINLNTAGDLLLTSGSDWLTYAQVGHGGEYDSILNASGNINVTANNIYANAGTGSEAYIYLGHGGLYNDGSLMGDITVNTGQLHFTGGSNWATFTQLGHGTIWGSSSVNGNIQVTSTDAQFIAGSGGTTMTAFALLGHGGTDTEGSLNGNISLTSSGDVLFRGGSDWNNFAQFGHNSYDASAATMSGNLTLNAAGDITFEALSGSEANVQLGHGGMYVDGSMSGDIAVSGQRLLFKGGSNWATYAQLGHGTIWGTGSQSGNITVTVQDARFLAGSGASSDTAFALLGHGGTDSEGNKTGNISLTATAGDILFQAAPRWNNVAVLGHYSYDSTNTMTGSITVSTPGSLSFIATSGDEGNAQLGHGGSNIKTGSTLQGDIAVEASAMNLTGGSGNKAYSKVGHGGEDSSATISGDITVDVGAVSLLAGTGFEAIAQIGHGGDYAQGNMTGNIAVTADTLLMQANSGTRNITQIGHGSYGHSSRTGLRQGHINIDVASEISLVSNGSNHSYIGHRTATTNGVSNADIVIKAASLDFSAVNSGSFTINNSNFVTTMQNNLAGGAVTLASTNADIVWNQSFTPTTNNSFSLISEGDISFLRSVQLNGAGNVNVVAGWDGSTGLSGTTFTMTDVLANSNSYGNGNGSIFINTATGTAGVAVGSRNGATTAVGYNASLIAGNSNNEYAQLGFRDGAGTGSVTGQFNGSISLIGGSSSNAYSQIGHGGDNRDFNFSGAITISAADSLTLAGGSGNWAVPAMIGHGGINSDGNKSGAITLNVGNLTLTGGSGEANHASIGHGGAYSTGQNTGDISITSNNLNLANTTAGTWTNYTQIGHGGAWNNTTDSGNITITTGAMSLTAGGDESYSQLGHGGIGNDGNKTGNITITSSSLSLRGGPADTYTGYGNSAQVGHGGSNEANGNFSGNITINTGNFLLEGGSGSTESYASVGHGAADGTGTGSRQGMINIQASGELSIVDSSGTSYIGHRTSTASGVSNANVLIKASALDFANDTINLNDFTVNNANFVTNLQNNLAGGNVTLASTNAPIVWDSAFSANSSNTLSVLGVSDVTINQAITNNGNGSINLVAGWDSSTGYDAASNSVNLTTLRLAGNNSADLTLNALVSGNAGAGNRSILAAADGNFINNHGTGLNAGSGYYLVYATAPHLNVNGSLTGANLSGGYAGRLPASLNANSFIYDYSRLTVTPTNQTTVYGDALNQSSYTLGGVFLDGDTGVTGQASLTGGLNVGSYTLQASQGTLNGAGKYQFAFNSATHTVTPRRLQLRVADAVKAYGTDNPSFRYVDFSSQLANGDSMASVLGNSNQFQTAAQQFSPIGDYSVFSTSNALNGAKVSNYNVQMKPGVLRVLSPGESRALGVEGITTISATSLQAESIIPVPIRKLVFEPEPNEAPAALIERPGVSLGNTPEAVDIRIEAKLLPSFTYDVDKPAFLKEEMKTRLLPLTH